MRDNLLATIWKLGLFVVVCSLAIFATVMVFAQLRFQDVSTYRAEFSDVGGLEQGNFVRIAGVEVGKVEHISIRPDTVVDVEFTTDDAAILTQGTRAIIRYDNLIGGRYLELRDGAGSTRRLERGQTIPLPRTQPALDLDALIGGFRPLFRALDPDTVNALSGELITAFEGQGATMRSFLAHTAELTGGLADRDELIGQVITNLRKVLGTVGDEADQVGTAISALTDLVGELDSNKVDFTTGLARISDSAGQLGDGVGEIRPRLPEFVAQADRVGALAVADHDYLDNLLKTLPDSYQLIARQGMYGDFFSYYICDLMLKMNGKGGQPVYVKVAGQDTGRCEPI